MEVPHAQNWIAHGPTFGGRTESPEGPRQDCPLDIASSRHPSLLVGGNLQLVHGLSAPHERQRVLLFHASFVPGNPPKSEGNGWRLKRTTVEHNQEPPSPPATKLTQSKTPCKTDGPSLPISIIDRRALLSPLAQSGGSGRSRRPPTPRSKPRRKRSASWSCPRIGPRSGP